MDFYCAVLYLTRLSDLRNYHTATSAQDTNLENVVRVTYNDYASKCSFREKPYKMLREREGGGERERVELKNLILQVIVA